MIAATLTLAMGATLLGVFRLSGSPGDAGVLVFMGAWLVAIACALHVSAVIDRPSFARFWRAALKIGVWGVALGLTAWAIGRAPGPELLAGLLTVPALLGLAGVLVAGRDRWAALGFALVALALAALLVPAALERLPTT